MQHIWQPVWNQGVRSQSFWTQAQCHELSPNRYVSSNDGEAPLPLEEALVLLAEAEEERAQADAEVNQVLAVLGSAGWRGK